MDGPGVASRWVSRPADPRDAAGNFTPHRASYRRHRVNAVGRKPAAREPGQASGIEKKKCPYPSSLSRFGPTRRPSVRP